MNIKHKSLIIVMTIEIVLFSLFCSVRCEASKRYDNYNWFISKSTTLSDDTILSEATDLYITYHLILDSLCRKLEQDNYNYEYYYYNMKYNEYEELEIITNCLSRLQGSNNATAIKQIIDRMLIKLYSTQYALSVYRSNCDFNEETNEYLYSIIENAYNFVCTGNIEYIS